MEWDRARILWVVTLALLAPGLLWTPALWAAALVTVLNLAIYRVERRRWSAFPVQVRVFYLLILLPALWPPLSWIALPQVIGTALAVFVDYCPAARIVSLMPWNRGAPLTGKLVWETFRRPPVRNVMTA